MKNGVRPQLKWGLTPFFLLTSVFATATDCVLDSETLDRGETKPFLLCGEAITTDVEFSGFAQANIDVLYRQSLRRCAVGDRRPGLFLVLRAGPNATDADIEVRDRDTGEPVCDLLRLEVPARAWLPDATLEATADSNVYRLAVVAPDGVDFADACSEGLKFPAGRGFGMSLAEGAKPSCQGPSIKALVRIVEGPQAPAKVIVPAVNGIVHVAPPQPAFLNTMAEADAKFVDVDGVHTRYFEKGEGEVLILVHGGQPSAADFNAWEWQQNFDGLAQDFRVIALDRIGQGYTDNPANLDDYADYYQLVVRHLHGFIRALGLERVHLVGHSQGGWPVTRIAVDHPELVASLVIVDSTMVAPATNAAQAIRFYIYLQNELHPESGETLESIRRGLTFFSHTNNNITDQRVQRILVLSQTSKYTAASKWFHAANMNPAHPSFRVLKAEIWEQLSRGALRAPTLIIWGRQDPEGSFDAGVGFYEALDAAGTDVRFHAFDDAGHVAYMEYPDEFNRVITEFIRMRQ